LFVLSLLLSIRGLKSKVSGFAVAGIILASLGILFWLFVGLFLVLLFRSF
jgi:hypothetical protein